ncbi:MAG TPA: HPP family protein [Burkholderiaceae bacterium]
MNIIAMRQWLLGFVPGRVGVGYRERLRACVGALIGIFITGAATRLLLGPDVSLPMLVAPMGASAVLLFALPSSPLAQPWSIIGGNLVSAAIGVTCVRWIADPQLAASMAIAGAIGAMLALRCLHPPSGAVALTAVLGGPAIHALGYHFLLAPIGINSLLLLCAALLYNNLTRHRYPHPVVHTHDRLHATQDQPPGDRLGFTPADLDYVLKNYNEVLDVSRDDLESLLMQTEMHAYRRRLGEISCAEIMSRDVVAVEFGTSLAEAWDLLQKHSVKALPVVDRARRVIGIVSQLDFMRHVETGGYEGFAGRMRNLLKKSGLTHTDKPEVVGQIMTRQVHTADERMHIVELVPLLSEYGVHHIPVLNAERRLCGIVTNTDLVVGLYRGRLADLEER